MEKCQRKNREEKLKKEKKKTKENLKITQTYQGEIMSIEGKIIEFCKNFISKLCKILPLKFQRKIIVIPFHRFLSTKPPTIYNFLESSSRKIVSESPGALVNDVKPSIEYQKKNSQFKNGSS